MNEYDWIDLFVKIVRNFTVKQEKGVEDGGGWLRGKGGGGRRWLVDR